MHIARPRSFGKGESQGHQGLYPTVKNDATTVSSKQSVSMPILPFRNGDEYKKTQLKSYWHPKIRNSSPTTITQTHSQTQPITAHPQTRSQTQLITTHKPSHNTSARVSLDPSSSIQAILHECDKKGSLILNNERRRNG